jgi:hypothetical protein
LEILVLVFMFPFKEAMLNDALHRATTEPASRCR